MAVPSQLAVYRDSKELRLRGLFLLLTLDKAGSLFDLAFMGYPDVFALVGSTNISPFEQSHSQHATFVDSVRNTGLWHKAMHHSTVAVLKLIL